MSQNDDDKTYKHESFGMLQMSRVSCGGNGMSLFGSSVKHNHLIAVRIHDAVKNRHLHQDWYHPQDCLVEVYLSPLQFIDAMTNINTLGVPCTLRAVCGKQMDECPEETKRAEFQEEIRNDFAEVANGIKKLKTEADKILAGRGNMSADERKKLSGILSSIIQHIGSNMPFVGEQFQRQLNKSVVEAKSEVAAFFDHEINRLGVVALKEQYGTAPQITGYEDTQIKEQ